METTFDTVSIYLAAAILERIEGARLGGVSLEKKVDGKRLIQLRIPVDQDATLKQMVQAYQKHDLKVNLYGYNRRLNQLRDAMKEGRSQ